MQVAIPQVSLEWQNLELTQENLEGNQMKNGRGKSQSQVMPNL